MACRCGRGGRGRCRVRHSQRLRVMDLRVVLLHDAEIAGQAALAVLSPALLAVSRAAAAACPHVFQLLLGHLQLLAQPVKGGRGTRGW